MLKKFFEENSEVAIAFSAGVDSTYLLFEALKYAKRVKAYYCKSVFQSESDLVDLKRFEEEYNFTVTILNIDVLSDEDIRNNPSNRCYFCKRKIFGTIVNEANKEGISLVIDGTNASDIEENRPGMKAIRELKVRSPLRELNITKDMIRKESEKEGLFTFNKPADSCIATRVKTGQKLSTKILSNVENIEKIIKSSGIYDYRLTCSEEMILLKVKKEQMIIAKSYEDEIIKTYCNNSDNKNVKLILEER